MGKVKLSEYLRLAFAEMKCTFNLLIWTLIKIIWATFDIYNVSFEVS